MATAIALTACHRKTDDLSPYIIFTNAAGEMLTSSSEIPAALNNTVRIMADIGYERTEGNNIDYDWKIDDGEFKQYSSLDGLVITTLGSRNNLRIEKATMDITFSDDIVGTGSTVTIRVEDQTSISRSLTFRVE